MNRPTVRTGTLLVMIATLVLVIVVAALVTRPFSRDHAGARSTGVTVSPAPTEPPPVPRPVFPDESTTGVPAGTVLTPASGEVRVTTPATVLDALDLAGNVVIAAPDVVITRSKIHGTGSEAFGIMVESGSVTISDSEIFGFANGIGFDDWSAHRVNIHDMSEDGVKLGSNVTLADSYIHDLTPGPGAHGDGAQMQDGVRDLVVTGNVIDVSSWDGDPGMNAALFLKPDFGPSSLGPVTIAGNYLNGGGYVLYCVTGGDADYVVENIAITDNRFGRSFNYGPAAINAPMTQSGNVWDDTGLRLSL